MYGCGYNYVGKRCGVAAVGLQLGCVEGGGAAYQFGAIVVFGVDYHGGFGTAAIVPEPCHGFVQWHVVAQALVDDIEIVAMQPGARQACHAADTHAIFALNQCTAAHGAAAGPHGVGEGIEYFTYYAARCLH